MINNSSDFRKMFSLVMFANNSDCSRIDAISTFMGVERDVAKKIYFDKVLRSTPCNVGYNMLLDGSPWPVNKSKKTIVVFGRDVKLFNY